MDYSRLDIHLHGLGLAESRNKARELILGGSVTVDGRIVSKPSAGVPDGAKVEVIAGEKYVGRAGYKLETAVEQFGLGFGGLVCLDAGAGAGGFTDLMLKHGAERIYAVDVGENQLHSRLKQNPAVINMEKQDVRTLELSEQVDFITADLSFISLKKAIPVFGSLLKPDGSCLVLIKPQFEAGRIHMKNGVLNDEKLIREIVKDIEAFITGQGFAIIGTVPSKMNKKGKNSEFICYFKRSNL
jgi:23S rRNA (cytidine1920-2'-O)/16S rRNA (cytidine1409-2'-O)-methyltransferase